MSNDHQAAAQDWPLPPLPQSMFVLNPAPHASAVAAPSFMVDAYTADQMREYVLADRRAAVSSASADSAMELDAMRYRALRDAIRSAMGKTTGSEGGGDA